MELITGTFKSQVYFNGHMLDVSWVQSVGDDNRLLFLIKEIGMRFLEKNEDFRNVLYRRSLQIDDAKKYLI